MNGAESAAHEAVRDVARDALRLLVLTPHAVLVDAAVRKVVAEAQNGSFALLPRHVDTTAALVPGILAYLPVPTDGTEAPEGNAPNDAEERFVAVDEGILVKCGGEVLVSCRSAAAGADLGELEATVRERFRQLDRRERRTRAALARLEADFVRRFVELREPVP